MEIVRFKKDISCPYCNVKLGAFSEITESGINFSEMPVNSLSICVNCDQVSFLGEDKELHILKESDWKNLKEVNRDLYEDLMKSLEALKIFKSV